MVYDKVGSGDGRSRIMELSGDPVDYAGSDSDLTTQQKADYPNLMVFPTMAG